MKRHLTCLAMLASLCTTGGAQATETLLFSEDFNSIVLGDSVNERLGFPINTVVAGTPDHAPVANVYSATAPGWTVDNNFDNFGNTDLNNPAAPVGTIIGNTGILNQGSVDHGVDEWEGWSFVDKDFWVEAAGDQDRSLFTNGVGTVAVADPDEYDDLGDGRGGGYYNTGLTSDFIDISAYVAPFSFLDLTFDSSWRDESYDDEHTANATLNTAAGGPGAAAELNNQTAVIRTQYFDAGMNPIGSVETPTIFDSDNGGPDSIVSGTFKDDTPNETLVSSIPVPNNPAVQFMQVTFGLVNAGNDWWWAIDNLELSQQGVPASTFWTENFEGVTLGDSVNEQRSTVPDHVTVEEGTPNTSPRPNSFSNTAPAGWNIDNTGTPVLGQDDQGVFEFEGWNFMDSSFWTFADTQGREQFTKADGVFAVADGDEWDDLNDPDSGGIMQTLLETPSISLAGAGVGEDYLLLEFDSSWRDEDANLAVITVDFGDGNGPQEILRWESDGGSTFFKDDNTNESVSVATLIPAGASSAEIDFLYEGGDDWWWAVDNIQVSTSTVPEPTSMGLALLGLAGLGLSGRRRK